MTESPDKASALSVSQEVAKRIVPLQAPQSSAKRDYRKPGLKRLGLLRSVTGSDIVF